MLGLRTKWGVDTSAILDEFNFDLDKHVGQEIKNYERSGKLTQSGGIITLTDQGKLIADRIAAALFTTE